MQRGCESQNPISSSTKVKIVNKIVSQSIFSPSLSNCISFFSTSLPSSYHGPEVGLMAFSSQLQSLLPYSPTFTIPSISLPSYRCIKSFPLHISHTCCRITNDRRSSIIKSSLTLDSSTTSTENNEGDPSKVLLEVKDLTAVVAETGQQILNGVNLVMREGEVHAVMGKNGSGKSTFSKVLVGHPDYEVTGGSIIFKGENLLDMTPEERSLAGLFMSFQTPVEIPGVSNDDFLRMAYNARQQKLGLKEVEPLQFFSIVTSKLELVKMEPSFLNRNVNEGFSGGERKRNEILQLAVLGADVAILDEIDSGLDVDALQDVAQAVNMLLTPKKSVIMVTHYQRLLDYIKPKYVHIMEDGRIIKTGDISIAKLLEKEGYKAVSAA